MKVKTPKPRQKKFSWNQMRFKGETHDEQKSLKESPSEKEKVSSRFFARHYRWGLQFWLILQPKSTWRGNCSEVLFIFTPTISSCDIVFRYAAASCSESDAWGFGTPPVVIIKITLKLSDYVFGWWDTQVVAHDSTRVHTPHSRHPLNRVANYEEEQQRGT